MEKKYFISVGSPIDYEELVVSIIVDNREILQIDQENGKDKLRIEIYESRKPTIIDYDIFIELLEEAKKELLK